MTHPKKNTDNKWSRDDEEKYIDEVHEAASQIVAHKEEFGGYIAISADTLVMLIESHRTLKQIRTNN
jgi:hypothetical protein